MSRADPIALIDAAYRVDVDDDEWLRGILDAAHPLLSDGFGLSVWVFRIDSGGLKFYKALEDGPLPFRDLMDGLCRSAPDSILEVYEHGPVSTLSENFGLKELVSIPMVRDEYFPRGVRDQVGVLAMEPDGWGLGITAALQRPCRLAPRRRALLQRITGHLQAAHRLRRRLGTSDWDRLPMSQSVGASKGRSLEWAVDLFHRADGRVGANDAPTQAILDPAGRVLDALGDACEKQEQRALVTAALAVDRVRARMLRGKDDGDALAEWRALVDGRWSLVDHFDTDGRRFLLARRNAPGARPEPLLDERERAVLGYRAAGHSLKLIAYEMGFSVTLTSRLLKGAMDKIGVRSASDLVQFGGMTAARRVPT